MICLGRSHLCFTTTTLLGAALSGSTKKRESREVTGEILIQRILIKNKQKSTEIFNKNSSWEKREIYHYKRLYGITKE